MKIKSLLLSVALLITLAFNPLAVLGITKKATIRVEGMHCKMCSASVTKALKATQGVTKVEVSLERKEAVVEYDDEKVTEAKLREVINSTGFKAVE
jgi:copper chaperone CopZ